MQQDLAAPRRPRTQTVTSHGSIVRDWAAHDDEKQNPAELTDTSRAPTLRPSASQDNAQTYRLVEDPEKEDGLENLDQLPPLAPPPNLHSANNGSHESLQRPALGSRGTTIKSVARSLPSLKRKETKLMQKEAHPMEHLGITLGLPAIVIFDIVVPCIIYYTWFNHHRSKWVRTCHEQYGSPADSSCPIPKPQFDKDILGYAVISFGFGELWILLARIWRLVTRWEECSPLLSRAKWELDATSWVYGVSMLLALIPFVTGASLVMPHLYLYGPSFIMGFLGLLMLVTEVFQFRLPVGINSQPRGTKLRPFIYYAAEDFIAVDGLQDRQFRERYNERYESNKRFRQMFSNLTYWWMLGVSVYIGAVSAVIWTCEFHTAFGLSLGVLFSYIAIWAATSAAYVKWETNKQERLAEMGEWDA